MAYILKTAIEAGPHYTVPKKGSAKRLTNGDWVYVWVDHSRPDVQDGRLVARGQLLSHQYVGGVVTIEISAPSVAQSVIRTADLHDHKGSPDPVWGAIAKVLSNSNHRIFAIETSEAASYLASLFDPDMART